MKNKLVIWGTDAENKRVLVAMELRPKDNKVDLYTFPEAIANEEFAKQMMEDWRADREFPFPDGYTKVERELTGSLLPDDLKVDRGDIVQRAQTEWHFVVLSTKLSEAYSSELNDFREKIESLTKFDDQMWENLKGFSGKVEEQIKDRNLFREHADSLRDNTNVLFGRLKELRTALDTEFINTSKDYLTRFKDILNDIEGRVAQNQAKLGPVFDELKEVQRQFREAPMRGEHRSKVWEHLDALFKAVKEKRFGTSTETGEVMSYPDRLQKRYDGLMVAIQSMDDSIKRDEEELSFQNKKIATTGGQLEMQIRQAKIKMVNDRIISKREKLNEMLGTKAELEGQVATAKDRESKRVEKEQSRPARPAAVVTANVEAKPVVVAAAEPTVVEAAGNLFSSVINEVMGTVNAVVSTLTDKVEDAVVTLQANQAAKAAEAEKVATTDATPVVADEKKEA